MNPAFQEPHAGFDREGPGDDADTARALAPTGLGGPLDFPARRMAAGVAERALAAWTPLARAGGRLAFSEAVWRKAKPDPRASASLVAAA